MSRMRRIGQVLGRSQTPATGSKDQALQAALESGLLRVGDHYSRSFMQKLVHLFDDLLGPDYGQLWFEPVAGVPVGRVRHLPGEPTSPNATMMAWRLYNHRLYRQVWNHGPFGSEPENLKPNERPHEHALRAYG